MGNFFAMHLLSDANFVLGVQAGSVAGWKEKVGVAKSEGSF